MDFADLREAPAMSPDDLARALAQPGRASLPYVDRNNPDRPLVLECFRPQSHDPDKPVVIVQHGASRNGAEYCGAWVPAAERHGLLIVAITYPKGSWPDAVTYNNGHVLDDGGNLRLREGWSLAIPGRVFSLLREAGITRRDKTYLWGHSAGGQFVHRLLATQPHGIFEAVGAANSGWYTLVALKTARGDKLRADNPVIYSERARGYSAAAVAVRFHTRFRELGVQGASSHSGRRTFMTSLAKRIIEAGGSLRDVQELAGHTSLATTQKYIQGDSAAKRNVMKLI
jgi:pimeloyl-ACP methyl ester carboxylesterase